MARKEFTYRGKTLAELREMSIQDFAKLADSRARRSLLRGFDKKLEKKIEKAIEAKSKGKEPKPIRTHLRDALVIPKMVGLKFAIYKGNSFESVEIDPKMLGHYLGEYALTRKRLLHGKAGIGATRSSTAISSRG
ncbi:MAG: 30S ribosomal protein S19 [Candidatus Diapherotrites archaeon]|nr:30S ribosomal protein S19 [Candidatus Diapherotrites archaeon]